MKWLKRKIRPELRVFIECVLGMVIVFAFMYYTTHSEDKNSYSVCTVKSVRVEIVGGQVSNMTDGSPKVFSRRLNVALLKCMSRRRVKIFRGMFLKFKWGRNIRCIKH